ncbi:MAG: hypothetical protein Ct9H300mP25_12760 [Acidobacteriota bacterium]|nr:MAG: hypothetical protein Ct9H300mP25_12760 [Acidobacteriota bacterium]
MANVEKVLSSLQKQPEFPEISQQAGPESGSASRRYQFRDRDAFGNAQFKGGPCREASWRVHPG